MKESSDLLLCIEMVIDLAVDTDGRRAIASTDAGYLLQAEASIIRCFTNFDSQKGFQEN